MKLTEHFDVAQVWGHPKAIPTQEQIRTCYVGARTILEPLRVAMECPIIVTCGYRTPEDNKRVEGAAKSEHTFGAASIGLEKFEGAWDINLTPNTDHGLRLRAYRWLMQSCRHSIGQLIWYLETGHLHVSLAGPRHAGEFLCCVSKARSDYRLVKNPADIVALDPRLKSVVVS